MYRESVPFPVYDVQEWWGNDWDAKSYGLDVSFERPMFSQMADLQAVVPRLNNVVVQSENCDYANFCFESRNCYLVTGCVKNEDCAYGHIVWQSKNCIDCL